MAESWEVQTDGHKDCDARRPLIVAGLVDGPDLNARYVGSRFGRGI